MTIYLCNQVGDIAGKRPLKPVEPLHSEFSAVGTNYWFVWPEETGQPPPPRLSLVSPKVFSSILSPMEFWFLAAVASGLLSWGHFISSHITDLIEQILFKLNWAGRCITEFNNEMPSTENVVFNLVILHYWQYFAIVQLFWHNLYC